MSSRSASRPRPRSDVEESRSVSDRSALLVAAETLNDKPDVVWSERTTAAGDTGGFCPTGAAVARAWYRWCAGQGKQVFDSASIANRDKYHPHFGELLHYLLSLYAFDGLVRRTLSQRRPCAARSTSSRFAAGPGPAERRARSLRAADFFFFLKLALRKRSRPPPPQTHVLRFASFCELLRRPLNGHHCGAEIRKECTLSRLPKNFALRVCSDSFGASRATSDRKPMTNDPAQSNVVLPIGKMKNYWKTKKRLCLRWLGVINLTRENLQIGKHQSGRRSFSSAD